MRNITNKTQVVPLIFLLDILDTTTLALLTIGSQTPQVAPGKIHR